MALEIQIFIALYFIRSGVVDNPRFELTRKILEHYKYIISALNSRANISFVILGSYDEQFILNHINFENYTYHIFEQNHPKYYKNSRYDFNHMLSIKINSGMKLAIIKKPDIVLWAGSNDFVSLNFFDQMISEYSPNVKQMYGISKHGVSGNVILLANNYHNENELRDKMYWNGHQPFNREKFNYCGAILGMNSALYTARPSTINMWNFDEGACETNMRMCPGVEQFIGRGIFVINPKSLPSSPQTQSTDITPYNVLCKLLKPYKLEFENLPVPTQIYINEQLNHWYSL